MNIFSNIFKAFGLGLVIVIIGTLSVRPHWFGIITPETVTPEEWEQSSKSKMIPNPSAIAPITAAPKAQGQFEEESADVSEIDFFLNLGETDVTFKKRYLNQRECAYLASEGTESIHWTEFISIANAFITAEQEYFYDTRSVTPLEFYVEMLYPFCPELTEEAVYELYGDYMTEVVQPAILYWNSDKAPQNEIRADIRNTHQPRSLDYPNSQ